MQFHIFLNSYLGLLETNQFFSNLSIHQLITLILNFVKNIFENHHHQQYSFDLRGVYFRFLTISIIQSLNFFSKSQMMYQVEITYLVALHRFQ